MNTSTARARQEEGPRVPLKRILVALDPGRDTAAASRFATELAARSGAELEGIGTLDAGAGERVEEAALRYAVGYAGVLEAPPSRLVERIEEGAAYERILDASRYHDLVVIGRDARPRFSADGEEEPDRLAPVVCRGIAPVLVAGERFRMPRRVLFAYDASDAAARTLQCFAQLRLFGTDVELEVAHVRASDERLVQSASERMIRRAGDFLRAHGFAETTEASLGPGEPGEELLAYAASYEADVIVAGAHGSCLRPHAGLGSTTRALIRDSRLPLFLFH